MRTKKIIFTLIIASFYSSNLFSQLKVVGTSPNSGSVSIGYSGYSNIWLGSQPNSSQYFGFDKGKWGLEVWGENLNIWKPWPSANNGDGNYYMFFTPSGAIGVGQVPTHQSEICLDVKGKVYSYGSALSSDERLKTEIKPLTDKLDKLYQLNGKSYKKHAIEDEVALPDIKDKEGNIIKKYEKQKNKYKNEITEFGFLAQELKEVYPELVSQDTLGYYYVNYIGLIPVLVEALKEQKLQIDELSAKINGSSSSTPKKVGSLSSTTENPTDLLTYPVLEQNIPNPFNTATTIGFYLPNSIATANIYVYDMNGVQLKSYSVAERGKGNITIQGSEFISGMYLYALIADGKVIDTKRMILTD